MFSLSVGALAGLHISLLLNNGTTVEMGRQPTFVRETRSGFKLDSKRANFAAIFGPDPLLWPLPIATTYARACHVTFSRRRLPAHPTLL